jgi:uncharacterized protein YbjT (DUF2867 family)
MKSDRTILITGVTGNQGGAVAQALQGTGFHLRGLTRKPDSQRAAALARQGIDIVKGDLDDEATLINSKTAHANDVFHATIATNVIANGYVCFRQERPSRAG